MGLIYVYLYRSVMFGWYIDTQTSVVSPEERDTICIMLEC